VSRPRPLTGLRVLDFTRVFSGPYATLMLADLGADVIKVEHPGGGDDSRTFGPFVAGTSSYFETLNRGKRSLAVDYRSSAGQALLRRLVPHVDVLIENFRPGQMARYGLDYATLQEACPELIYVSISGFGQDGAFAGRGCYDVVAQAESGLMALTGTTDLPCKTGPSIGDAIGGLTAAVGLLAALWDRERSKRGAHLDIALVDALFACLENALATYDVTGRVPERQANRDSVLAPFDCFAVVGGWIAIGVGNDGMWKRLAALIGGTLAGNERFTGNAERLACYDQLRPIVAGWCSGRTLEAALAGLHAAGIPAGAVRTIDELAGDPRLEARGMLARVALGGGVTLRVPGTPMQFADMEAPAYRRGPRLGEHTRGVLTATPGIGDRDVDEYARARIVALDDDGDSRDDRRFAWHEGGLKPTVGYH
jgi:CoA:oxalate CoA-transferase